MGLVHFLLYFGTCTFFVIFWDLYIFCFCASLLWIQNAFTNFLGKTTFFTFPPPPSPISLPFCLCFCSPAIAWEPSESSSELWQNLPWPLFLPSVPPLFACVCAPCWACRGCWKGEKGKKRQELALFDGVAAGLSEDPCYVARVTTPLLCLGGLCSPSDWEVGFLSKLGSQLKLENYFFQPDCAKVVVVLWRPPRRWKTKKGKVTPSVSFFWLASHTALFVLSVWGCLAPLCAGPPLCWLKSLVSEQVTWLILPVVICLSQRLSHACPSTSLIKVKPRMAH